MIGEIKTSIVEWDRRFMRLAIEAASWSKDPQKKVGAAIVTPQRRVVALGYNGFPIGLPDLRQELEDDDFKRDRMVHAELNAILNAERSVAGCWLYSTRFPCHECMKAIVQAGIARVLTAVPQKNHPTWGHSYQVSEELAKMGGVEVLCFPSLAYENSQPVLS